MLNPNAGKQGFLYDSSSNTIHDLSNETEACKIILLNKSACQICDSEKQVDDIALSSTLTKAIRCPYCFQK